MTIFVLKKEDSYVAAAIGTLRVNHQTGRGERLPDTEVKLYMTKNIEEAKLVENPNMDAVNEYGLEAIEVRMDKPSIREVGTSYEMVN